ALSFVIRRRSSKGDHVCRYDRLTWRTPYLFPSSLPCRFSRLEQETQSAYRRATMRSLLWNVCLRSAAAPRRHWRASHRFAEILHGPIEKPAACYRETSEDGSPISRWSWTAQARRPSSQISRYDYAFLIP